MANVVELDAGTSVEREARTWLIRMDGDEPLTAAEKQALREWMNQSAVHRAALVRLTRFWNQANILAELGVGIESVRSERESRRGINGVWTVFVAGVVLASLALVYCVLKHLGGPVTRTYETVVGEQKAILLSDGSSLELNTDSEVKVTYSSNSRRVRLLRGEVLLSATRDPHRVFDVYVADSVVRAVGTDFAVHLEGRKVDVRVTKGTVDVFDVGETLATLDPLEATPLGPNGGRLRAGEETHFESGSGRMEVRQLTQPELQRRMAWQ